VGRIRTIKPRSPSLRHILATLRRWDAPRHQLREAVDRWVFSGARYGLYSVPNANHYWQMVGGP
jgi:hypothetical protein